METTFINFFICLGFVVLSLAAMAAQEFINNFDEDL